MNRYGYEENIYIPKKPENCMVVEDALAGIEAAYAGGFESAGIGEFAGNRKGDYLL